MEGFRSLGGSSNSSSSNSTSKASFLHLPLSATAAAAAAASSSAPAAALAPLPYYQPLALHQPQAAAQYGHHQKGGAALRGGGEAEAAEVEAIKAKIMSHPQYSALLGAHLDCQKVGAPPDVVDRLSAVTAKLDAPAGGGGRRHEPPDDPELDQFMEAYCNMLVKYREELTRPIQEAMDFLRRVEAQLNSLTDASARISLADGKCEGVGSSEDDLDPSGRENEMSEIDPRAEDKELKYQLLKKYSGYLSSLRQEFSKKKKKGKLPKEARQKLLSWWEMHYKWPYPSETEKTALAEATGLDQKQINNWFINQRKRHWKGSEEMPFVMMEGFHPQNAALYMEGPFIADGMYRLGS